MEDDQQLRGASAFLKSISRSVAACAIVSSGHDVEAQIQRPDAMRERAHRNNVHAGLSHLVDASQRDAAAGLDQRTARYLGHRRSELGGA